MTKGEVAIEVVDLANELARRCLILLGKFAKVLGELSIEMGNEMEELAELSGKLRDKYVELVEGQ